MFSWFSRSCIILLLLLPQTARAGSSLTVQEEQLAAQIGFDREVLVIAKRESDAPLHRLSGYDESGYQIKVNGLSLQVPHAAAGQVRTVLRDRLAPYACLVFIVEQNEGIKRDRIGIIKGIDQFSILKVMRTNGDDDNVSHETIMERLRGWYERTPFEIIGAENDWVELEFRTLPRDLVSFAEEVYKLSPDAVDDGPGTIYALVADLKVRKRLMLMWD